MSFTANDMMAAVKRYAAVPTSQVTFEPEDFYALGDDSIRLKLVPLILKEYAEFYVYPANFAINQGLSKYPIPTRAINSALRSVQIVSNTNDDSRSNLEQLSIEDLYGSLGGTSQFLIQKNGFYIEGNSVVLYPSPIQSVPDILRLNYFIRPGQLTDIANCGQIQSVDYNANTITCVTVPSTFTSAGVFDLIQANPGFDYMAIDQTLASLSGNVMTFTNALPTNISVGDWVCPQYLSCILQVPVELQPLLTQYVVVRVLSAQGDAKLKDAIAELEKMEKNASILLTPRVQGSVKRVTNSRAISRWV